MESTNIPLGLNSSALFAGILFKFSFSPDPAISLVNFIVGALLGGSVTGANDIDGESDGVTEGLNVGRGDRDGGFVGDAD